MSWDLAISENGDLIVSGHGDLLGRTGEDLIEQRIRVRLTVFRGGWVYDTRKTLGSNLHRLIGMSPTEAASSAPQLVREALRDMDEEITVEDIDVITTSKDISLIIHYRINEMNQGVVTSTPERVLTYSLPMSANGGE